MPFDCEKFEKLIEVDKFLSNEWEYEKYGFEKKGDLIPYISFPQEWEVMMTPPFRMAMVRFRVRLKDHPDSNVSVYLDCHDHLGYVGEPYWEVYPYYYKRENGERYKDVCRCLMKEKERLLEIITEALQSQI